MRTNEEKYLDALRRGRTIGQMRSVAVARGDLDFRAYLVEKERQQAEVTSDLLA